MRNIFRVQNEWLFSGHCHWHVLSYLTLTCISPIAGEASARVSTPHSWEPKDIVEYMYMGREYKEIRVMPLPQNRGLANLGIVSSSVSNGDMTSPFIGRSVLFADIGEFLFPIYMYM